MQLREGVGAVGAVDDLVTADAQAEMVWAGEIRLPMQVWNANILTMNDRKHHHQTSPCTRFWRTHGQALGAKAPKLKRGRVVVYFQLPKQGPNRRTVREVANLQPVVKAITDGLVDRGVFPDDADRYVWGQDARRSGETATEATGVRCFVTLWA